VPCKETPDGPGKPDDETRPEDGPRIRSPPDVTVSGLAIYRGEDVDGAPEPLVDLDKIRSGGPPPDGIPSIDEPKFIGVDAVDFLEENEPVLAVAAVVTFW
jgi:hypothetical protein